MENNMKKAFLLFVIFLNIHIVIANDVDTMAIINEAVVKTDTAKKRIYKFNIKEDIMPGTWRQTKKAFAEADSFRADLILLHMNTYGGTVLDADSIRTKILNSKIPVYVFIDNNAISAGALISISCDSIYMRQGSTFGATTVVNQTGEKMPEKVQSVMRTMMRATAEAQGMRKVFNGKDTVSQWVRNPLIAEAMVDERVVVPGISDSTTVISFTPNEALKYGFCEAIVDNQEAIFIRNSIGNYEIKEYKPTPLDRIIGFLTNPIISGILIMMILGGIYFELQSPGVGFPLIIALIGVFAYFAPLYLEGLAAHWEILIFVVGLIFIVVEILAFPGFGIFGISGIVLVFTGLVLALIDNINFNFEWVDPHSIAVAFTTVIIGFFGGILLCLYFAKKIFTVRKGALSRLALSSVQETSSGFISIDQSMLNLMGKSGTAFTVLRPSGKVMIEGKVYDAMSNFNMIEQDEDIIVVKVEATQLYVEKVKS